VPGLKKMVVALFRILDGMDFESIDGEPVYMVLVMAGPHSSENVHLRLLARIAKLVRYDSFIESVLRATSPREVISMFRSAEMRIP
jgi:PTS system fructose-specific IIC component